MLIKKWPGLEELICLILLAIVTLSMGFQVVNRFLLELSVPWTEELARYAFIWLSFIGISLAVKRESHLSVDLIKSFLNEKSNKILKVFVYITFLLFCLVGVIYGLQFCLQIFEYGQRSAALQIKMGFVYLAVPVGLGLASFRLVQKMVRFIKKEGQQW